MGMRKGYLGAQWVVLPLRKEPRRTCTLASGVGTSPNAWPVHLISPANSIEAGNRVLGTSRMGSRAGDESAGCRGQGQDLLPLCRGRKGQRESGGGGQAQALYLQKLFHGTATVKIIFTRHPSRAIVLHVVGLFRFRAEVSLLSST